MRAAAVGRVVPAFGSCLFSIPILGVLWIVGCTPSSPPPAGGGDGDGPTISGDPITDENVNEFVVALTGTLEEAIAGALADPTLFQAKTRAPVTKIGANLSSHSDVLEIPGARGRALASGLVFGAFWPPRIELTLSFEDYETADGIALNGTVEYNFVRDDRADPVVDYGIQAGTLTTSGRFAGAITVQSTVVGADRSTEIKAGQDVFQVGTLNRPGFLTYVSTIAGSRETGLRDGPAAQALFNYPTGLAVDDDGRVYVADSENSAVREIGLDGMVSTITTDILYPYDVDFDSNGRLVVSSRAGGHGQGDSPLVRLTVRGDERGAITPIISGTDDYLDSGFPLCPISTHSACDGRSPLNTLNWAAGIDARNQSVLVAQTAIGAGLRLALPDGFLMTVLYLDYPLTTTCDETFPGGAEDLAQGNNGEIYYTTGCHAIRVYETDGTVRTLSGRLQTTLEFADGIGDAARFAYPEGLVFDGERYLYVADANNGLIRRVDVETGEAVRVAGCLSHTPGFDCTSTWGFRDGPGDYAQFEAPNSVAIDRWGDLYVADKRNNAIRLVRIIADPNRTPSVFRFDPAVAQQGDTGTLTISGRNLTTLQSVDLGEGVTATVEQTGYQRVTVRFEVAADAEAGPRPLTVRTAFGEFTTPEDLSFTILADTRGGIQVETIAGTGSAEPDRLNYGPAQNTTFAFPGGIHAISEDRLLVADPLEQRIRLIATRTGAVEEFFQLLTYAAGGTDVDVLGTLIGVFDSIEQTLDFFGLSSGIVGQEEDAVRDMAEMSVDAICDAVGADNCTWLSLPWAGTQNIAGTNGGFRLNSRFFLPTDIWADAGAYNSKYYIADSGNSMIRVVGYDIEQQADAPMQVFDSDDQPDHVFAVTPLGESVYASLPSSLMLSQLSLNSGAVNGDWASIPRGVPLGIASGGGDLGQERSIFVADPLNATIWRVIDNGGVAEVKNIRGSVPSFVIGDCVDGPATFATWGAPMDVAVDQTGTVYVADAGCNSIRVIKDSGFGQDLDGLVGSLREYLAVNQSRISPAATQRIEENLRLLDTQFLDDNRFFVSTLAGSPDGQPGFEDGPAALARFNAPTSVAIATTGEGKVIFVADTGNRRIRRIVIP